MNNAPLDNLVGRRDVLEGVLSRIDVWLLIFGIFVVIGVAGESVFGIRAWWNNRKLHAVQQGINELRQAEISRFTELAATAEARAVEAKLELAKFKAPREISFDQRKRIISRCKGFPRTPFILLVDPSPEAVSFLAVIEDVLVSSCGWSAQSDDVFGFAITTPKGYEARMKWGVSGIAILFSPDKASDFGPPAKALADALTAEGVKAKAEINATADKKALYVLVGQKPN